MDPKEKDTMRQFLQKQPRSLTMARYTLGIYQMRVMATCRRGFTASHVVPGGLYKAAGRRMAYSKSFITGSW